MPAPGHTGDDNRVPNSTARSWSIVAIPLAVIAALVAIYFTMVADPGSRPADDPKRKNLSGDMDR